MLTTKKLQYLFSKIIVDEFKKKLNFIPKNDNVILHVKLKELIKKLKIIKIKQTFNRIF